MVEAIEPGSSALERLCAAYGLATSYDDIWGKRVAVADETLVALLAGLGVEAGTPQAIAAAMDTALERAWREPLPPVAAIRAGAESWVVPLRLPGSAARLRWTLVEEDGSRHEGEADATALGETARAEFPGGVVFERRLEITLPLPQGYHRLGIDGLPGETLVIAAPAACYSPPAFDDGGRVWGPAVQLYALRSERNWGMGDFGDLGKLVEHAATMGAGIIGLNPLHGLFPHSPAHASPYSPSSRLRLNVLYLDVEAIEDFRECEAAQRRVRSADFQRRLAGLRDAPMVDYPGVASAKFEILELLYAEFRERHLDAPGAPGARDLAFRKFQQSAGKALRQHAICEALQAHFHALDARTWGWPVWPEPYREHASPAVAQFVLSNLARIEYFEYLQWQAEQQLAQVSARCRALGLAVGLYLDLAVSVDGAGSDTWTARESYALEASIGAPPDEFNPNGQGWGLPPYRPDRLRADGYRLFIATLRENMRDAGALRIDHVMGLMRLYWIPAGKTAREGTYVHYALDELLAIVALESARNRCMVIGEDLGTVAAEMRVALERRKVLSYRLLYFEHDGDGRFRAPAAYPRDALVAVSTHDLATLAGWWSGHDLQVRLDLDLFPSHELYETQRADRARERTRLLLALQEAGHLSAEAAAVLGESQMPTPALVDAIHAFVADAPSRVMMVQLEDVMGVVDQINMPGTTDQHPNWNRKLPQTLDKLAAGNRLGALSGALAKTRPHAALNRRAGPATEAAIPRATYRLQFHKEFDFDAAIKILPYIARLGISHVYCSPILRARPGSMHGYDIVAHDEINPELGGAEGFERFSRALRTLGLGQLLDIVPNHMGVLGADNSWWMDVLENGPASEYGQYFDIDWHPINAELDGKVLVPALGDHYGNVLQSGELVLVFEPAEGSFAMRYHEHRFPLNPRSYRLVLRRVEALLADPEACAAVSSLTTAFGHLPRRDAIEPEAITERTRDKEIHKGRLARLAGRHANVARAIEAAVAELNAAGPRDALHELLEAQAYRLTYWRVGADEINYRRFFDINDLAALRMENEQVFEATHAFALELAASGVVDGLRIDHPDGLYDPAQYFRRLQEGYARRAGLPFPESDASGRPGRPLYVVAEKIIAPHERMPENWHVHGTTGYRFAMVVNGVLVDTKAEARFDRIWHAFSGNVEPFEELAYRGKRAIMRSALASELTVLSAELLRIARSDRRTRDYTFNTLREALAEVAACMPVYRTYIIDGFSEQDQRYVDWALAHARRRSRAADTSIFDFVRRSLLGQTLEDADAALRDSVLRFATRFQQLSSPVAAKGVEDTAFYRYNRLASLNEVGGEPSQFGLSVRAFHRASANRAARWPHTMLATSTHDNKRSEDVRNRINVLSEIPAVWRLALRRWSALNRSHRTRLESGFAPSRADEYLLYQTLLGAMPAHGLEDSNLAAFRLRIEAYAVKAARESKADTSWISPNDEYEGALVRFIGGLLGRLHPNPFLDDLRAQVVTLARLGALNSLVMSVLKYTSPGVPDLYQGSELIDLSLVDPDNRRPVDYALRMRLLAQFEAVTDHAAFAGTLLDDPSDGRAKLWVIWRLLQLRRQRPALFAQGGYKPLTVRGATAANVVAFCRSHGKERVVVATGRLFARMTAPASDAPVGGKAWGDTRVEAVGGANEDELTNVLTGERVQLSDGAIPLGHAFATLPVAVFVA